MDIKAFRDSFPEFADIALYTDAMVKLWGEFAEGQVDTRRWGCKWQMGVNLYTAHELVLASQSLKAANVEGVPGNQSGPTASKTVGSVSVAYDTQAAAEREAGHWNLTSYGKQFIRLARIFGVGAVQL